MPISIRERPEVFTDASLNSADPPFLIRSDALALLTHELRRYCKREISGRSFLIAGHRGAGKTTLVLSACQQIFKESEEGRVFLRPLVIMLQGPNLLPNQDDELPVAEDADKTQVAQKKISPMENVLRQITLGLYGALAREIAQAFRRHAEALAAAPNSSVAADPTELIEFAAALELELDEYPGKARLRRFYEQAGVLDTGVLRPSTGRFSDATSVMKSGRRPDQGMRELVALCSACEAYRRISGTFTSKQEDKHGAKATDERKIDWDLKGKDILTPLLPVVVGTLAGAGLLTSHIASGPLAAFAAIIVAIGSAFAFKYSIGRSRERSATREDLFIPDLRVATLDRVLPVLIERLRSAGLAPVFVIDELDKVKSLSFQIPEMVRRLKKLVAENALFCFLTDRTYYEQMRSREEEKPYSIEHTSFTHQLFLIFRHRDLHIFLKEVLQPPDIPSDTLQLSTVALAERDAENQTKVERDDAEVLRYLLLYAARMHSIDLRRELLQIRDDKGDVTLRRGELQANRRYGLELQMQVAIETLLNQQGMQWELDRRPEFRRLAHDALYYLAARWEDAEIVLDLRESEDGDAHGRLLRGHGGAPTGNSEKEPILRFKEYLCSRMVTDPADNTKVDTGYAWRYLKRVSSDRKEDMLGNSASEDAAPTIRDADLKLLWKCVRDLAASLSSHEALLAAARLFGFPEVVLKAVSLDPLLVKCEGEEHIYRWCWYPSGRQVQTDHEPKKEVPAWQQHVDFIRSFEKALSKLTNNGLTFADLGASVNIISTSPPWKIVEEAMARLETLASGPGYADQDDDADKVAKFDALLKRSSTTIAHALCAAKFLRHWREPEGVGNKNRHSLATISYVLSLRDASEASIGKWMQKIFDQFRSRLKMPGSSTPPRVTNEGEIEHWRTWVDNERKRTDSALNEDALKDLPAIREKAWAYWYRRLSGNKVDVVNLDNLICARRATGPWFFFTLPIEEMTVRGWSEIFCSALSIGPVPDSEERPPIWMALATLSRLGFGDRVSALRRLSSEATGAFRSHKTFDALLNEVAKWPLDHVATPTARTAFTLRRGESAAVGAWKPDAAHPLLIFSRAQGEALGANSGEMLEHLKKILFPDTVFFDLVAEDPAKIGTSFPPSDEVERLFSEIVPSRPPGHGIAVVLSTDISPPATPTYFCIISPKSSEELFRQLAQQEETAKQRTPPSPTAASV